MSSLKKVTTAADALFQDGYGATLCARAQRRGMSEAEAKRALAAYKKWLVLKQFKQDYGATKLSPPPAVDAMWHEVPRSGHAAL